MSAWMRAEVAPEKWRGSWVWRWNEYDRRETRPQMETFPANGYSRATKHCGGVWFKLVAVPKVPRPPLREGGTE